MHIVGICKYSPSLRDWHHWELTTLAYGVGRSWQEVQVRVSGDCCHIVLAHSHILTAHLPHDLTRSRNLAPRHYCRPSGCKHCRSLCFSIFLNSNSSKTGPIKPPSHDPLRFFSTTTKARTSGPQAGVSPCVFAFPLTHVCVQVCLHLFYFYFTSYVHHTSADVNAA